MYMTCPSDQGGRHLSCPQLGSTIRYEGDVGQGAGGEHRRLGKRNSCIVLKRGKTDSIVCIVFEHAPGVHMFQLRVWLGSCLGRARESEVNWTPVHQAAYNSHISIVKKLICN